MSFLAAQVEYARGACTCQVLRIVRFADHLLISKD